MELDLDERGVFDVREYAPVRAGLAGIRDGCSAPGFLRRGHARSMDGVAANGQFDGAGFFFQNALHKSDVLFFHGMLLKGFTKPCVRGVVLGDEDDSGSLFVETMYDSRA